MHKCSLVKRGSPFSKSLSFGVASARRLWVRSPSLLFLPGVGSRSGVVLALLMFHVEQILSKVNLVAEDTTGRCVHLDPVVCHVKQPTPPRVMKQQSFAWPLSH